MSMPNFDRRKNQGVLKMFQSNKNQNVNICFASKMMQLIALLTQLLYILTRAFPPTNQPFHTKITLQMRTLHHNMASLKKIFFYQLENTTGRCSPNLIVMFLSSSFLKRTVCTPEIAFTTVDLPWATWPIVPILIVACLLITSGDKAVSFDTS